MASFWVGYFYLLINKRDGGMGDGSGLHEGGRCLMAGFIDFCLDFLVCEIIQVMEGAQQAY